jgi:AcrR family transcriptional regulator
MALEPGAAREAMLDRCMIFLQRNGFSELSLRGIAAGVGTSHRMLLYHFGSREGVLAQVVGRMEADQRTALAQLSASGDDPAAIGRTYWRQVSDPSLAGAERLFFEIYAQALYGREWTESFRASVITAWEGPLVEFLVAQGFTPAEARARARLGLAVTRGLLLDLLITGDREAVDAAADLFNDLLSRTDRPA